VVCVVDNYANHARHYRQLNSDTKDQIDTV